MWQYIDMDKTRNYFFIVFLFAKNNRENSPFQLEIFKVDKQLFVWPGAGVWLRSADDLINNNQHLFLDSEFILVDYVPIWDNVTNNYL